jgi:hypothetical protein
MPERKCSGCTRQAEWGCSAFKWREPDPETVDERECWVNPADLPADIDGEQTFACPRQPLHQNPVYWQRLFLFYGMYKQGLLPQSGAVIDQSNKAIEVFRILDDVNQHCDKALEDRAALRRNRDRGGPR